MNHSIFFPNVAASSLERERFRFPESFGADVTLAIIGFWDWQQPALDGWTDAAKRLELQSPGFEFFEMPVIQRSTDRVHRFIDKGMRDAISDRRAREKTVPVYVDKRAFMRSLGLPTDDEVYAVLVDRSGLILRVWTGSATPVARHQLEALVWATEPAA